MKGLEIAVKRSGLVGGRSEGISMACSCVGRLFCNPCNVQPSFRTVSNMVSSGFTSQLRLISPMKLPSASSSALFSLALLKSSFLPLITANFSAQGVGISVSSFKVHQITVQGGNSFLKSLLLFPPSLPRHSFLKSGVKLPYHSVYVDYQLE